MTDEQSVAYVQSQATCALIEAMGMQAENANRKYRGEAPAYDEKAFTDLIEKWGIHHNGVLGLFHGR
jgi:hypothetical protein